MAEHEQEQEREPEMVSRAELDAVLARLAVVEAELAATRASHGGPALPAAAAAPTIPGPTEVDGDVTDLPVDRRSLLRRGGLVAGAVAAGTAGALLNASPAAAAPIAGDGNPGVTGTGVGGIGVYGISGSSHGVSGYSTSPGSGATHGSTGSIGVFGMLAQHTNGGVALSATTTGASPGTGVQAIAGMTGGTAVRGTANGTNGTGVRGDTNGTNAFGVVGWGNGPGGAGVYGFGTVTGVDGTSTDGIGVKGSTTNGTAGVSGSSSTTDGVLGTTSSLGGAGVHGVASEVSAVGVLAENSAGVGLRAATTAGSTPAVKAEATTGPALDAFATGGYGAALTGGGVSTGANLRLVPTGPTAPSRTGTHLRGEIVEDLAGDLWLCTATGPGGTWRKIAGPATAGAFHPLATPVRIYDSRNGAGIFTNTTRTIDAKANTSGVPAGATAVLVNLAVTNTNSGGFGALWTNGVAWPGTANINWGLAASTISNSVVTAVDATALFQCRIAGTADVIIDVIAYYR